MARRMNRLDRYAVVATFTVFGLALGYFIGELLGVGNG